MRAKENCQAAQATAGEALDQCASLQAELEKSHRKPRSKGESYREEDEVAVEARERDLLRENAELRGQL